MAHGETLFRATATALISAFEPISGRARQLLPTRYNQRAAARKMLMSDPARVSLNAIASAMGIRAGKDFVPGEVRSADCESVCLFVMAS